MGNENVGNLELHFGRNARVSPPTTDSFRLLCILFHGKYQWMKQEGHKRLF